MVLSPGTRVGPYEVMGTLGAGGMGEVYRARDAKLGRDVALKLLPPAFASDPERLGRFHREAQVLASLNHPHIAQIYGFEESGDVRAFVMELVEGPTLADLIVTGPVDPSEALRIARQIALALEAAHDRGITHRDLKPSNVKVAADGSVKVLDFGLAKLSSTTDSSGHRLGIELSASPTLTSPGLATGVGVVLGTAAYMSPEQARGKAVDKRADVWAFGCVLVRDVDRPAGLRRRGCVRHDRQHSPWRPRLVADSVQHLSNRSSVLETMSDERPGSARPRHRGRAPRARRRVRRAGRDAGHSDECAARLEEDAGHGWRSCGSGGRRRRAWRVHRSASVPRRPAQGHATHDRAIGRRHHFTESARSGRHGVA